MTRGARHCFFSSFRSRRLAARLSRRLWTRTSSTTPSWSTALVHRAPEPVLLAGDLHLDLVQVPLVSGTGEPVPDLVGERLAELARPLADRLVADRLVADRDAAGRQKLIHHAQAQGEAEGEPDRVADDLGREAIASVVGAGGRRHLARLPDQIGPG